MGKQVNRTGPTQKNHQGLTDDAVEYVIPKGAKSSAARSSANEKKSYGLEQESESVSSKSAGARSTGSAGSSKSSGSKSTGAKSSKAGAQGSSKSGTTGTRSNSKGHSQSSAKVAGNSNAAAKSKQSNSRNSQSRSTESSAKGKTNIDRMAEIMRQTREQEVKANAGSAKAATGSTKAKASAKGKTNIDRMAEIMRQTRMEENRKRTMAMTMTGLTDSAESASYAHSTGLTGDKPSVRSAKSSSGTTESSKRSSAKSSAGLTGLTGMPESMPSSNDEAAMARGLAASTGKSSAKASKSSKGLSPDTSYMDAEIAAVNASEENSQSINTGTDGAATKGLLGFLPKKKADSEPASTGLPNQYENTGSQELPPELEEQIARNIERRKKKRNRPSPFKLACITIAVAVALLFFMSTSVFTIDTLKVEGNSYFTDEEIINMAHASTGKNLFFHSGSREIINYLESSPYIQSAKVSKKVPGTLVIKVKEREQMAALVYNKEYLIIDEDGLLLRRSSTKPKVTILTGIKLKKMNLGENIEVDNEERLQEALDILKAMKEGDLYFKKIVFTKKTIKAYVYDALVCKGDAETLISSMEKERLQKILETLFDKGIKRGTITFTEDGYASFEPKV
jgi:cell division protein FtsQ